MSLPPVIVLAALALAAADARAIPPERLPTLAPPQLSTGAGRVTAEAWHIDCAALATTSACRATLTQTLVGPAELELADAPADVAVQLDGAPLAHGPRVNVPAGTHHVVVVATLALRHDARDEFLVFPPDELRHLVLHAGRRAGSFAFEVEGSPLAARAEGYTVSFEIVADAELGFEPIDVTVPDEPPVAWQHEGHVHRLTHAPHTELGARRLVSFSDAGDTLHYGGPMLGLGLGAVDDATWFAARVEYEVALVDVVLPGVSLDIASHGLVLTPRVEVSTPQVAILPALWAGVGLPIRLAPDPDLGARLLLGLQMGPVGGLVSLDLRPRPGGVQLELTALVRFSI